MNIPVWVALAPVFGMSVTATSAIIIVLVALKGTTARDRASVLKAVAEVIRAARCGRR
jgi:hypothetical protein